MTSTDQTKRTAPPQDSQSADIVHFPRGMVGFHNYKEFSLAPIDEAPPFLLLSAVQEPELAFIMVNAIEVDPDYRPKTAPWVEEALDIHDDDKPACLLVVNLDGQGGGTVNLRGPVLINPRNGQGAQMALDETFPLRKPLLQ